MHAERRPRGFTLVELLVVIGIIAVLLSILLPVLGKARASAQQLKCMSNLRQLSITWVTYTVDNSDAIASNGRPPGGGRGALSMRTARPRLGGLMIGGRNGRDRRNE